MEWTRGTVHVDFSDCFYEREMDENVAEQTRASRPTPWTRVEENKTTTRREKSRGGETKEGREREEGGCPRHEERRCA